MLAAPLPYHIMMCEDDALSGAEAGSLTHPATHSLVLGVLDGGLADVGAHVVHEEVQHATAQLLHLTQHHGQASQPDSQMAWSTASFPLSCKEEEQVWCCAD